MLDKFVYACGQITIVLTLWFAAIVLITYVKSILKKQTKIKCLCHHEYEPDCAFYNFGGIVYTFKCRKCGKEISVKTIVNSKFDQFHWIKEPVVSVEDFIRYAKEDFGYDLILKESDDPDTFEKLFGEFENEEI